MEAPIKKYKQKVVEYQKFLMECHARYGDTGMKAPMEFFGDYHYDRVRILSAALSTAEDILSLSQSQKDLIWEECKATSGLVDTWTEKPEEI